MIKYKLFITFKEKREKAIVSRRLTSDDKEDYYRLIKNESDKGNSQLILTKDIILKTSLRYIVGEGYSLKKLITDCCETNEKIARYIEKAKSDRAYLVAVTMELMKKDNIGIDSLTLQNYDEEITFHANGVVSTNTILDKDLLSCITDTYLGYVN